ncbi:MAG: hypothetical protein WA604_02020 [Candidatus Sulfotelmatobacter sp.]
MATDSGNWYKIIYTANNQTLSAVVRAATPNAAVTAGVADVTGLLAANVIEVQSIDPQPVTINS